ncbi:MAG: hypothetical protein AAFY19_06650 [Pseudomonadota bacterium]
MKHFFAALSALLVNLTLTPTASACSPVSEGNLAVSTFGGEAMRLFEQRPRLFLENGAITQEFYDRISKYTLQICEDHLFDARVFQDHKLITLDASLVGAMANNSIALILGQFINAQQPNIPVTQLFEVWNTKHVPPLGQSAPERPNIIDVANQVAGFQVDLRRYPTNRDFALDVSGPFVHSLAFVFLHEWCHVGLDHFSEGFADPETSRRLEEEADRCAIEVINLDEEAEGGLPGLNMIGAITALGTQIAFEAAWRASGDITITNQSHPFPVERFEAMIILINDELDRRGEAAPITRSTLNGLIDASRRVATHVEGAASSNQH